MRKNYFLVLAIFALSWLVVSCCDDSYDLNSDIDSDITIGGENLYIPLGNTKELTLFSLLDLEDDDTFKVGSDGDYYLDFSEEIDPKTVSIPEVNISETEVPENIIELKENWSGYSYEELAQLSTVELPFDLICEVDVNIDQEMPEEVVEIESMVVYGENEYTPAYFEFIIEFDNIPSYVENIEVRDLTFDLPSFFNFGEHEDVIDGVLHIDGYASISNGSAKITRTINIEEIETHPLEGDVIEDDSLRLNRTLDLDGMVYLTANGANVDLSTPIDVTTCIYSVITEMNGVSMQGTINPESQDISYAYASDLGSLFGSSDVDLDLMNSYISLGVTNSMEIPMIIDGSIAGNPSPTVIPFTEDIDPATAASAIFTEFTIEDGVSDLIRDMPDSIYINAVIDADNTKSSGTIYLGRDFEILADCEIVVPLTLGAEFKIEHELDFKGILDEIGDYVKNANALIFTIITTNTIPLEFSFEALPIDANDNVLTGVDVTLEGEIASATKDASGSTSAVFSESIITIEETVSGQIAELDGLRLTIVANSSESVAGVTLNDLQSLKLELKAQIKGGLTISVSGDDDGDDYVS
ncbi:MAG: hypothetical protein R3Y04_03675, partial [Rikenellaceae bacterium]